MELKRPEQHPRDPSPSTHGAHISTLELHSAQNRKCVSLEVFVNPQECRKGEDVSSVC